MNRKYILLFLVLLSASACKKYCWQCTAILYSKVWYIKNTDTVMLLLPRYNCCPNDTILALVNMGYVPQDSGDVEIPANFSFCDNHSAVNVDDPNWKCYPTN